MIDSGVRSCQGDREAAEADHQDYGRALGDHHHHEQHLHRRRHCHQDHG